MRARTFASLALAPLLMVALAGGAAAAATSHVLLVGSWHGVHGQYRTIQSGVDAAQSGDWILVGPGDYHESAWDGLAGVYITTPGLHLRGMDRNRVIVDGTLPQATKPCDPNPSAQDFGPVGEEGYAEGRNGVWVDEVSGVSVENLTACNFLSSKEGENGNPIWFDVGDGSGHQNIERKSTRLNSSHG